MQDRTINSALLSLRKQALRGDGRGLEHILALLELRNVDLPRVLPAKRPDAARRGQMTRIALSALRDGPRSLPEISGYIAEQRPEISYAAAYRRTGNLLSKLKNRGMIEHKGRLWSRVKPPAANSLSSPAKRAQTLR